jgi:hypothetical protein
VLGGIVLINHLLDPALGIAAGSGQILIGVGKFIYVQFLPRFGEFQLLGESSLFVVTRGGEEFGEAGDLGVTLGNLFFSRGDSCQDGANLGTGRCRLRSSVGERCIKGKIDFMVGYT